MATMISEVYDAFRSVGVPEDKARAAAEALSEEQLATKADIAKTEQALRADVIKSEQALRAEIAKSEQALRIEMTKMDQALRADISRLEKEILVIKWMLGLVIVAVVIPLIKSLFA